MTLPDFWSTIHEGNVKIVRDNIDSIKEDTVLLGSGRTIEADFVMMCTGWGDHFAMFDDATKAELGLPAYGKTTPSEPQLRDVAWEKYDMAATKSVHEKLPFLAQAPRLKNPHTNDIQPQRHWKL